MAPSKFHTHFFCCAICRVGEGHDAPVLSEKLARSTFDRKSTHVFDHLFLEILPVGQILSLYALVESSLPHRNLLNSSLAADPPQRVPGEPRAHPRELKELKIMAKEV